MYKSKLLNLNFEVIFGSLNSKVMDIFKMLSCSNLKSKKKYQLYLPIFISLLSCYTNF